MNVLFVGDIVGKVGRRILANNLNDIYERYGIHFSIANCENAAGGFGMTKGVFDSLMDSGIDVLTSGNHIWDKKEILSHLDQEQRILRPANFPDDVPGRGSAVFDTQSGGRLGIINISGVVFMKNLDCPFRTADREIDSLRKQTPSILVDFHGEATSEKMAMGWYLDGRVSAVLGTHTHVQTSDERILPEGTAYITDVGMTGPRDSVIGMKPEIAVEGFLTRISRKFEPAKGEGQINAVVLEIDERSGKTKKIERITM